ncbi:hypothetical protein NDU88_002440 [Pleurodeles waltl]|uniref:Uncharacterized protein n=1 Tax=Pleurodeles waltl TaxID=8319 RepID=A0AAV7SES3_PLEWA|nr:hypothetical protein NDU88_002440 [Pleurodeles waltl]
MRSPNQKPFYPNKPTPTTNVTNLRVKMSDEQNASACTEHSTFLTSNAPRWRKRVQPTTAPSKIDKTYNDNYNESVYQAPAWRKRIFYTKADPKSDTAYNERRGNGANRREVEKTCIHM